MLGHAIKNIRYIRRKNRTIKTRRMKVKSIENYIHCTLSNIVNIVPTNLQFQLEQNINLFQDKRNCLTDALVQVLSIFGKSKSQKMLLSDVENLVRLFLVIRLQMNLVKGHSWR